MRSVAPLMALLIMFSMLLAVPGPSECQDGHDSGAGMIVSTEMQLTSMGSLSGTGCLTVTFSGEAASDMRQHMLSEFDSNIDQIMEPDEVSGLLDALSSSFEGRSYWGITMSFDYDFANMSSEDAVDMTDGIVGHDMTSTSDISVSFDFSGDGQTFSKVILITQSAVEIFRGAIEDVAGYRFDGIMRLEHRTVMLGVGSFTSPETANGTFQEVRTPAGVVLWYTTEFEVYEDGRVDPESIFYERFSVMENPQMAFVILFVGTYMLAMMPRRRFEKFRKLHPRRYRKYARPKNSVRVAVLGIIVAMWVLYTLPFVLSPVTGGSLLYSYYFMFIVPAGVVAGYAVSRRVYDRSALDIPEESVIEVRQALLEPQGPEVIGTCPLCYQPIEADTEVHRCESCGTDMHLGCAERAQACPACSAILFPHDTRSIECKVCGESFLHAGDEDPYSIQCTRCGAFQEEVEAGKNYLVIDRDSTMAYKMIRAMGVSGRPALVITAEFPGKIRNDFSLGDVVDVRWLSDSTTDIDNVNPKDLEGDAMETVSTFLMTTKRAGLLMDGLAHLIDLNGFEKVLAFIRRVNDLAMIHGSSMILAVDRGRMDEDEFTAVCNEFDELHDYS